MESDTERRIGPRPDIAMALAVAWRPIFDSRADIAAAWLFGSAARGAPAADIDVGLLLFGKPFLGLAEKAALCGRLEDLSPVRLPVDLRVLSDKEPLFSFAVLRDGVRIFERYRGARVAFEATVFGRFQDLAPLADAARMGLRRRLLREQG